MWRGFTGRGRRFLLRAKDEAAAKVTGVKRVCTPNRATKGLGAERVGWFRQSQKGRTGCEGRVNVVRLNGEMASTAAATRARSECTAGSASALSPTTSSTSVAPWKSRRPR
jgi:hypothetical protein